MRDFEEIRDTEPLSLKKLNDQLRQLWFRAKNVTGKDIRYETLEADRLVVGENITMGANATITWEQISNPPIIPDPQGPVDLSNYLTKTQLTTELGKDYVVTGKIYANQVYGGSLTGVTITAKDDLNVEGGINLGWDFVSAPIRFSDTGSDIYVQNDPGGNGYRMAFTSGAFFFNCWGGRATIQGDLVVNGRLLNIANVPSSLYFGTGSQRIDASGTSMRVKANDNDYLAIAADGNWVMYMGGTGRHVFKTDGTKTGGSIEIDGVAWGMSPIDSPRVMISDLIQNVTATSEGTLVELDYKLSKSLSSYSVFCSGCPCKITNKTATSFVVKGEGSVDLLIIGTRIGSESTYWELMPVVADQPQEENGYTEPDLEPNIETEGE